MTKPPDDAQLLEQWRCGDREAGRILFRRHVGSIHAFFQRKLPEQADELTQNTMLAMLEGDPSQSTLGFRPYLFGIARNQLLMHLRSSYRYGGRMDPAVVSFVDARPDAARALAVRKQSELLRRALQHLPIDTQLALELHYFEELQIAAIAEIQGVTVGTVKSRLSRGRVMLREQLAELTQTEDLINTTMAQLEAGGRDVPPVVRRNPAADDTDR